MPVHELALLHLVHVAVAGAVALEAHLVLDEAAVRLLEVDALLLHLHGDRGLAHADRLRHALHLADVGADLLTLGRAAPLGFNRATLLVGTVAASKRARGCEVCVDTRSLVSLDANFLLLDFTRSLNVVSAFGLGAGAALALGDVHTASRRITKPANFQETYQISSSPLGQSSRLLAGPLSPLLAHWSS